VTSPIPLIHFAHVPHPLCSHPYASLPVYFFPTIHPVFYISPLPPTFATRLHNSYLPICIHSYLQTIVLPQVCSTRVIERCILQLKALNPDVALTKLASIGLCEPLLNPPGARGIWDERDEQLHNLPCWRRPGFRRETKREGRSPGGNTANIPGRRASLLTLSLTRIHLSDHVPSSIQPTLSVYTLLRAHRIFVHMHIPSDLYIKSSETHQMP
jgi:hypothetical protein